jgi:hypothetical protein
MVLEKANIEFRACGGSIQLWLMPIYVRRSYRAEVSRWKGTFFPGMDLLLFLLPHSGISQHSSTLNQVQMQCAPRENWEERRRKERERDEVHTNSECQGRREGGSEITAKLAPSRAFFGLAADFSPSQAAAKRSTSLGVCFSSPLPRAECIIWLRSEEGVRASCVLSFAPPVRVKKGPSDHTRGVVWVCFARRNGFFLSFTLGACSSLREEASGVLSPARSTL